MLVEELTTHHGDNPQCFAKYILLLQITLFVNCKSVACSTCALRLSIGFKSGLCADQDKTLTLDCESIKLNNMGPFYLAVRHYLQS